MAATGLVQTNQFNDTFKSPLILDAKGVTLNGFDLRTPAVHARGTGSVAFDGTLDMSVNGGPVEAIQNQLGQFGKILGAVTDSVLKYRIRGSVADPSVKIQPLGIGG